MQKFSLSFLAQTKEGFCEVSLTTKKLSLVFNMKQKKKYLKRP
jgi:hypothetical protein